MRRIVLKPDYAAIPSMAANFRVTIDFFPSKPCSARQRACIFSARRLLAVASADHGRSVRSPAQTDSTSDAVRQSDALAPTIRFY
jgi:hypothetical protein